MPNCFGFIILDFDKKHTILVETPNGYLSYPKGKFEKKKDLTQFDCAVRELEEETGITIDLIDIVPNIVLSEYKKENVCSIQYYVGIMKIPNYVKFNPSDPEEIASVKWYDIDKIGRLDNLKQSRKDVFENLKQLINL
jgi:8-oxo-dGTP pyrophosphatase MutT (NUDIX family)